MTNSKARQIIPILIVLFLGYLGFALVLPIFPPMFLSKTGHTIVSKAYSPEMRTTLLGLLISTYPLGQLFGGPILGRLSDVYGRKKILVFTLAVIIPFYLLSCLAIVIQDLWLLFVSRFFCGLFEGNSVIAAAAMADISESKKDKVQKFGLILTVSSLGFILGPLIGGKLTDSTLVPWFNYSTPFWICAALVSIALVLVLFMFQETLKPNQHTFQLLRTVRSIFSALFRSDLRNIFLSNFFLFLSFFFFFGFFPVLLVWWYGFNATHIGEVISYLAIPICLSPLLYSIMSRYMHPRNAMVLAAILLMCSIILLLTFNGVFALYFSLIPVGMCIAIGWTYSSLIISDRVSQDKQGEALGTNQSITILAEIVAACLGGIVAGVSMYLPLLFSAGFALITAIWLLIFVPKDQDSHQEIR
ncbi:MAG: MFS transporter [Rhabdochlamydiaceae bacterium]|nr:MFS transporter [Candidatus Amphrikana amoebophyrae]